jgi:hypothetical protein
MEEIYPLKKLSGLSTSLGVQIITLDEIAHFGKNGGNPIGLKAEDGPLMCTMLIYYLLSPLFCAHLFLIIGSC